MSERYYPISKKDFTIEDLTTCASCFAMVHVEDQGGHEYWHASHDIPNRADW